MNLMTCRYSDSSGFELRADSDSLLFMAAATTRLEPGNRLIIDLMRPSDDPDPYDRYIDRLIICRSSGLINIRLLDGALEIAGSSGGMDILADNLSEFAKGDEDHLHIEPFPDHFYLSEIAEPLVVVRADDAPAD